MLVSSSKLFTVTFEDFRRELAKSSMTPKQKEWTLDIRKRFEDRLIAMSGGAWNPHHIKGALASLTADAALVDIAYERVEETSVISIGEACDGEPEVMVREACARLIWLVLRFQRTAGLPMKYNYR